MDEASGTTFSFGCAASLGTYTIGGPGNSIGTNASLVVLGSGTGSAWQAAVTRGSGSITVVARTAVGASGNFHLTLEPVNGGASGNRVVVGTFNVTFPFP